MRFQCICANKEVKECSTHANSPLHAYEIQDMRFDQCASKPFLSIDARCGRSLIRKATKSIVCLPVAGALAAPTMIATRKKFIRLFPILADDKLKWKICIFGQSNPLQLCPNPKTNDSSDLLPCKPALICASM